MLVFASKWVFFFHQIWKCEFCAEANSVDIMEEEKPDKPDVTFMLQPAPSTQAGGRSGTDDTLVIFCVDTSGSMCVTTEVCCNILPEIYHCQSGRFLQSILYIRSPIQETFIKVRVQ